MTTTVVAGLVDGGSITLEGDQYLAEYRRLSALGYEGKAMIHALLTDDWGPPPRCVTIKRGSTVEVVILYT